MKKLRILELAKLQTVLGALVGLLLGVLYSFGGLVIDALVSFGWLVSSETPGLSYGTVLAFGALIGMPAIFAVAGFVFGVVGGFLYNLIVGRFFGEIDLRLE